MLHRFKIYDKTKKYLSVFAVLDLGVFLYRIVLQ